MDTGGNRKRGTRGIVKLSDLFQKYAQSLRAPERSVIEAMCAVLREDFGIAIEPSSCRYTVSTRTMNLRVSGIVKSEVLQQKNQILKLVEKRIGAQNAPKTIL